jgi:hypothetical protein
VFESTLVRPLLFSGQIRHKHSLQKLGDAPTPVELSPLPTNVTSIAVTRGMFRGIPVHTDHGIWPTKIYDQAGVARPWERGILKWLVPSDKNRAEFSPDLIHLASGLPSGSPTRPQILSLFSDGPSFAWISLRWRFSLTPYWRSIAELGHHPKCF